MVGILVSFWDGLFSGAMLVLGSVFPTESSDFPASHLVYHYGSASRKALSLMCKPMSGGDPMRLHSNQWWAASPTIESWRYKVVEMVLPFLKLTNQMGIPAFWWIQIGSSILTFSETNIEFTLSKPQWLLQIKCPFLEGNFGLFSGT